MCRYFAITAVLFGFVTACSDQGQTTLGTDPSTFSASRIPATSGSEELALQRLLQTLPAETHGRVRGYFARTPGVYQIVSFPQDPQRQALVDRLYAERREADSRELVRRRLAARANRVPVTVALVDRLPDPLARSVVLRRRDVEPNDVILLASAAATADHLAAAIASLQIVRKEAGQYPSSNATISVRAEAPIAWAETELPRAERIVARLRETQPHEVAGVGSVPATTLWLKVHR